MKRSRYLELKQAIIDAGYSQDITWAEGITECSHPWHFLCEYVFVVCNSGMRWKVAQKIYSNVMLALAQGRDIAGVFGHEKKVAAILEGRDRVQMWFYNWQEAGDKLEYLQRLPHIGPITKYHLAKNLGMDVAKPDRHLVRIADDEGTTVEQLCRQLSDETGDSVRVIDTVLWRAAEQGIIK
jgi:hypothetical protein